VLRTEIHAPLDFGFFELVSVGDSFFEELDAFSVSEALCLARVWWEMDDVFWRRRARAGEEFGFN
jgi:hypothetical protein